MTTKLLRIIKYGLQSFKRNSLLSVATVMVMLIALLVFEGLIIFSIVTKTAILSLQDKIDISVYFKTSAEEDSILKLKQSLESVKEVKSTEYVSREKALSIFKERHANDATISQALRELEENPLLASLNIKANDPNDYGVIAAYLENENFQEMIESVTFTQSRVAIERLNNIVDTVQKMGLGLTIALAITAVLVAFNTIRLAIHANREEISVMRLVGASNLFINGPYIVEAVIFGILAAVVTVALTVPFINLGSGPIQTFIPEMDLATYFYGNIFQLFGYLVFFGVFLGIVSGVIAIRRYLKT